MRKYGIQMLALVLALVTLVSCSLSGAPVGEEKSVTVTVVDHNGAPVTKTVQTKANYLRGALEDAGFVEEDEDSFLSTVCGVTADYSVNQSWWRITKDGVQIMLGASDQPIQDGEHYTLTYTIGMDGW